MKRCIAGAVLGMMAIFLYGTAFAAGTIKIGGLFAVTGPASFLGDPGKKTFDMLVKRINDSGGIDGMRLEAVSYDTGGDATKAVQLATKLIKDDKVSVILGPTTTGESMAVIPVAEREKVPMISCGASIKIIDPVKRWVFKTPANDHVAVEKILNYMAAKSQKTIALLTVTDGFGASGREQLKAMATQKGFRIVADELYGPKDTDMTAQLTKIRGIKPDAIICWGTNPGPAVITRNIRQLGIKIPLYMSHGVASKKYIQLAGADAAEGVILPAGKLAIYEVLPKSDPQASLLREYDLGYRKAFHDEASTFGGYAYDAFMLIANAIKRYGHTPEQIRSGIEHASKVVSVSGIFNMSPRDHNGLDHSAFEMVRITKGDWAIAR
ncbi:ABC transporter substrate-binding protein [Geobacter argillaceus]|uniref:Amino acid/amide ABC transporter substrate-binding protein, HAAT family (TC 3.A.1.4.-) n=1 Tax=Geobacter argillaceus TaxID=345631 RepID=A0A562V8H0_9BACT|nr:ABC transporter substrate-binding protein [Geobacter argillaceus]TWJ14173.1 amino acid/amide ABC transporter substrate-binding protein, HAAT family (TC 3.A.1.4.-) [Geobacter argillaceus]